MPSLPRLIREGMRLAEHGVENHGQFGSAVLVDIDPDRMGGVLITSPVVIEEPEIILVVTQAALVIAREMGGTGEMVTTLGGAIPSHDPQDIFEERPLMHGMIFIAGADRATLGWRRGLRADDEGRFSWWGEWDGPHPPEDLLHPSQEVIIRLLERAVHTPFHPLAIENARTVGEVLGFHLFTIDTRLF